MDVHHHHHQHQHQHQYAQSDGHLPPAYDPSLSHSHSYEAQYYSSYPQPQYDPAAAYSHSHHQYYDYSVAYQQQPPPPPPGVDHAHPHHYMPAPQHPDAMEVAGGFSHEYAVPMVDGGNGGVPSQGASGTGGRFPFRGRGGRRGGRGGTGRGNFRGRGRGRGGGRVREPAQPPPPKPARQPKPHAWCDICRVDCNSVEILEQHRAGKRHKRTVQRIQEYEVQQKQLAGNQSAVISTTTGGTGPSVSESGTQTLTAPVAASATAIASEAGSSNSHDKVVIHEEQKKETVGRNQPATEGPSGSLNTEASETQVPPPSETNQADAAPSGKRSFTKRPRPDGHGLGFMYGYGGGRFDRGGRRGGRFDRGGKRPRRFGEYQPWPPMAMRMPPYRMMSPMPGPGPAPHLPRVRPIVCMLCNISCDTLAVFETHVAGKKHQTRISKCQGPNQVFGPLTIFIPPGQPTPHPQNGPEPVFYGLTTSEEIKQHQMLMQDEMEDEDEEEEARGDNQQDGNLEERAKDDGQDVKVTDNGTNDATNADESTMHNEPLMGPTGTADGIAGDENQNTKITPNDCDAVPDVQPTSELS